jgi:hypothetical protein
VPWTSPSTRSSGHLVTAANWNELVNNLLFLKRVAYTEFTADVATTATTVAGATQIVSAGAVTYENVPHIIEFYCPVVVTGATGGSNIILRDGSTVLGTIARLGASTTAVVKAERIITPTAASHTYNIAAWHNSAGTDTYNAGTGGTAGDATTDLPGFIRVTRIPT